MAKKPRTPPPPTRRPVQAPQRRTSTTQRSDADRRTLRMLMLFSASGIVALGVVIGVIVLTTRGGGTPSNASVAGTMQAAGCTLTTARATSRQHLTSLTAKVKYNLDPPASGSHYFSPAIWDFYTTPADPVQVVHNEEHGGVILWWGNKVPAPTVDAMRAFYTSSPNGMLGTPYAKLGSKIAITAWTSPPAGLGEGHLAVCPTFKESAFKAFRDAYRGQGPERYPLNSLTPGT